MLALGQHAVEGLGLGNGAWKAIEQAAEGAILFRQGDRLTMPTTTSSGTSLPAFM